MKRYKSLTAAAIILVITCCFPAGYIFAQDSVSDDEAWAHAQALHTAGAIYRTTLPYEGLSNMAVFLSSMAERGERVIPTEMSCPKTASAPFVTRYSAPSGSKSVTVNFDRSFPLNAVIDSKGIEKKRYFLSVDRKAALQNNSSELEKRWRVEGYQVSGQPARTNVSPDDKNEQAVAVSLQYLRAICSDPKKVSEINSKIKEFQSQLTKSDPPQDSRTTIDNGILRQSAAGEAH